MLPIYERQKGRAWTKEELDECIEVEVGTIATKGCVVYTSFGSNCNINLLTTSHSETRSDNGTTDDVKDNERQNLDDNYVRTVAALSAPCYEDAEQDEAILMAGVIQRVQGRIKSNGGDDFFTLSPTHRQLVNAFKEEGPQIVGILDEYVVPGGANEESEDEKVNADASKESDESNSLASSGQLASMMRDHVQAIESVRGFLTVVDPTSIHGLLKAVDPSAVTKRTCENEQGKSIDHAVNSLCRTSYSSLIFAYHSADVVFESRRNEKVLRHDVECLRHSNKELMKTVMSLLAKNSQLSSLNDRLEAINSENIQRMSLLDDDVAAKRTVIDELTVVINNINTSLKGKIAENKDLVKQKQLFKAESDGLRIIVQDLESKVAKYDTEVENLKSSMQEVNERNEALKVRVQEVSNSNAKLKVVNSMNEDKNAELLNVVKSVTQSLNNEKSSHEREVKEMRRKLEMEKEVKETIIRQSEESCSNIKAQMTAEMSALNTDFAQKLSQLSSKIDKLIQSQNENILRISTLEDDVAEKKIIIDEMTAEIDKKNKLLEEETTDNVYLADQLQLYKAKMDELEAAIQDMVVSNKEQKKVLEDDVAVKTTLIDAMSMDINKLNSKCKEIAAENSSLTEQVKISKATNERLMRTTQDLESSKPNFISEIAKLKSSLQEVNERNGALRMRIEEVSFTNDKLNKIKNINEEMYAELLEVVQRTRKALRDEKSHHEMEIEEIKHIFETFVLRSEETLGDVTAQMTAQVSAQKVNIAYLAKSLEEATVDNRRKMALLEEKTAENDDLVQQLQLSTCGLGSFVNISRLVKSHEEATIIGRENS